MHETEPQKGLAPVDEATLELSQVSAITLMRIYDVLISMYAEQNENDARELATLHTQGKLRAPLPYLDI